MSLIYMKAWRANGYVRLLVVGQLEDHNKLLLWRCTSILRLNPDLRPFFGLDRSRFKQMLIVFGLH